jgi:hypothetical protein
MTKDKNMSSGLKKILYCLCHYVVICGIYIYKSDHKSRHISHVLIQCVARTHKEQSKVAKGQDQGFAINNDH